MNARHPSCVHRSSFIVHRSACSRAAAARDHRADDRFLLRAGCYVEDRVDAQPHIAAVAIDDRLAREADVVVDEGRDAVLRRPPLEGLLVLLLELLDGHLLRAAAERTNAAPETTLDRRAGHLAAGHAAKFGQRVAGPRSEEHTSELQSRVEL